MSGEITRKDIDLGICVGTWTKGYEVRKCRYGDGGRVCGEVAGDKGYRWASGLDYLAAGVQQDSDIGLGSLPWTDGRSKTERLGNRGSRPRMLRCSLACIMRVASSLVECAG